MRDGRSALQKARGEEWILGSSSPRRQEILRRFGLRFTVAAHGLDEESQLDSVEPEKAAAFLASAKAEALMRAFPDDPRPLLCADTTVILEGRLLGQPSDEYEAVEFYRALAGKEHRVVTGLCVVQNRRVVLRSEEAKVRFAPWDEQSAFDYAATGEWRGAAGGYRLQETGEVLVESIQGSPTCVAGLPLRAFYEIILAIYADAPAFDTPAFGREI